MAVRSFWNQCVQGLRLAFESVWGYLGTLAAMCLAVGVLGMGLFHTCTQNGDGPEYRCFMGLVNCASAQAPTGVGEIPAGTAGPCLRFEYDHPGGKLTRLYYVDATGERATMPGSKVSEQRMEYDGEGRLVGKRNFSVSGEPVADASGVSARLFSYDGAGRLIRTTLLNESGEKVVPRMPGYAEERISYDAKGRPLRIQYLDANGDPITNASGECDVAFEYDDAHHRVVRTNTCHGVAVENNAGFASERRQTTADGQTELVSWLDKDGKSVCNKQQGAAAVYFRHHSEEDNTERHRLCGENGSMPRSVRACTEHLVRTTPEGLVEWECYNAADGLPCDNASVGYAERVCEYDKGGNLSCEYFWDESGHPCPCYEKRYSTTADGRRHVLSLHTDGSTGLRPVE